MKKIITSIAVVAMALSMVACGGSNSKKTNSSAQEETAQEAVEIECAEAAEEVESQPQVEIIDNSIIDEYEALVELFIENQAGGMTLGENLPVYKKAVELRYGTLNSDDLTDAQRKRIHDLEYKLTYAYTMGAH